MDDDKPGQVIDMAKRKPIERSGWFTRLQTNKDGVPHPTVANAMIIFANDPKLSGLLAYNAFTSQHLLMEEPPSCEDGAASMPGPYPRPWGVEDVALLQAYLQRVWSPKFNRGSVEDAMLATAGVNRFHPVTDWLDTLEWDGTPRLDNWLCATFGCENTPYHQAVAAKVLIAAVRRVRHPGCKFDYMLVLEGQQGIGKSESLRRLFGDWFSDAIPPDLTSKDAAMALLGIWCLEFSEIEHLIRLEVETIKAFLSRSTDRYRPPYGRAYVDRPRQGVLIGTTNKDDYLRDESGNRRIWPVRCMTADPEWISVSREQLWAEAAQREASGESIWLDARQLQETAAAVQQERMAEDVWHDAIAQWVVGRPEVTIPEVLEHAIGVPKERHDKRQQMRVGSVLRVLGWERRLIRSGSRVARLWVRQEVVTEGGYGEGVDDLGF